MKIEVEGPFEAVASSGHQWDFSFGSDIVVRTESLWRFLVSSRIKWVSEDHLQQFGLPAPVDLASEMSTLLSGNTLRSVNIDDATSDLELGFDDGATLQVLTTSAGYESWECAIGERQYICLGGGDLTTLPRRDQ